MTVLFADLVGFTARAESLDPEDVDAFLRPYHARVREELERWGGTVEKFIGDAVVAVFGAPVAREDDPERAVRAALAIRDWADESSDVEVRIAVNTGEALVSLDARPESGEGIVTGDVVNTASRLQSAAPVNGVLVGEQTYRSARHVIDFTDAPAVEAKGKAEPVAVWLAQQARSRFGVDVRQHGGAPLVGRARELEALAAALERVRAEREPQLVTLAGVPGIGKSRLVWELFEHVGRGNELTYWRQGRSLPYGAGVSFWALSEMVKAHAGILEDDDIDVATEKLDRAVAEAVEDEAEWVAARLRPLIGAAADGPSTREESFTAWRRFWESLAERHPLVLVFEDAHWADDALLDFVEHLVDWATGVPILIVCTARPELFERRPGWGGGKVGSLTLALSPLTEDEAAKLLALVIERAGLPAETQAALLERARGHPLDAEQFGRLFAERGSIDDLPIPETVHGLIAARLDTLPSDEKTLLQDAAVMGKVFWSGALGSDGATAASLHSLERKEFIRRERRSSVAGEEEYGFRHVLVRDVAYNQIPRANRAAKHVRAADWIEALGRPQDHAELLAHHCVAALELARASGGVTDDLARRAASALDSAGDRAATLNAFAMPGAIMAAALELEPDADDRAGRLLRLGRAEFYAENGGEAALSEAATLLQGRGDLERAAEAENLLAAGAILRHESAQAQRHLDEAERLAAQIPDSAARASVTATRARLAFLNSDIDAALAFAAEARELAERLGLDAIRAEALLYLGGAKAENDDATGIDDVRESIAVFESINSPEAARAYNNLAVMLRLDGKVRESWAATDQGVAIARRFGLRPYIDWDRSDAPHRLYETGDWDGALAAAEDVVRDMPRTHAHLFKALVLVGRGEDADAIDSIETACALAHDNPLPQNLYPALNVGAYVYVTAGDTDRAATLMDEVTELRRRGTERMAFGGTPKVIWAWAQLGRAREFLDGFRDRRRTVWLDAAWLVAEGDWRGAAEMYGRIGTPADEAFALLHAGGDDDLRRALDFFRRAGATRYIREAESRLAAIA